MPKKSHLKQVIVLKETSKQVAYYITTEACYNISQVLALP